CGSAAYYHYTQRPGMDLYKAIRDLYAEKERLERVIASLEELQRASEAGESAHPLLKGKRRGRKSMSSEERQEVSVRMKNYWANRMKKKAGLQAPERRIHSNGILLKKPQPIILVSCAIVIAHFKAAPICHGVRLGRSECRAQPASFRFCFDFRA